jgi:hypothetical protein
MHQTEQIRFWVSELTAFSPKQVEMVIEVMKTRLIKPLDRLAS